MFYPFICIGIIFVKHFSLSLYSEYIIDPNSLIKQNCINKIKKT